MCCYYTVSLLYIPFLYLCYAKFRAELEHLRRLSETQTKDLAEKTLHIQELEERERAATENVIFLLINL
jgi:signal transduction histidine kinase